MATKWTPRLERPSEREDIGIMLRITREADPSYVPPAFGSDPEMNREAMKQMLRDLYRINPLGLVKGLLGRQLAALNKEYGGTRKDFIGEAMTWVVPHLQNRYFDRDVARGDGQHRSTVISSNCIEYWDPGKGALPAHVQGYFARTLKPDLLEHFCHERENQGHKFYSIEAARECGMDLATTKAGVRFAINQEVEEAEPSAFEQGEDASPEAEKAKQNTSSLDLLVTWLDRNAPEMVESIAHGSRNERLVGLKRGVEEVLRRGNVEEKDALLEDFSLWDPRRVPLDQQYPEVVEYLAMDAQESKVRERVEEELNRTNSTMCLFPDMEVEHIRQTMQNKQREATASAPLDLASEMPAAPPKQTPEQRLTRMNEQLATYLGVEIPHGVDASEIARALMREWADCVLAAEQDAAPEEAALIDSVRLGIKQGVKSWDFLNRNPMNLVQLAVSNTVCDQDMDEATVESLSESISRRQNERRWLEQGEGLRTLKTNTKQTPAPAGRDEY